jgi:hypothetical protein
MKLKEFLINKRKAFWIWQIAAIVVWIVVFIIFEPWSDKLGVPQSPQRGILYLIMDFWVLKLPTALLAFSYIAKRDEWLAPRGRYVEGQKYAVFNTYTYTAIAFMAALFAVSGIVNHQLFDLPAAPAVLSVTYFHPIIGFFTLWIGGVLRSLMFASGEAVAWFISIGLSDGATWVVLGVFYWWFRQTKIGKNVAGLFIGWSVVYWVWRMLMITPTILLLAPKEMWAIGYLQQLTTFMPSSFLASIGGLIITEALIRTVGRRGETLEMPELEE